MKIRFHNPESCAGEPCAVHNPQHHMKDWPTTVRFDRECLIERICKHGVGHPDPHSVDYLANRDVHNWGQKEAHMAYSIHGCDLCCTPPTPEEFREDNKMTVPSNYRGVPVPARLRQYWDKPTGRAWRQGVDAKGDMTPVEVLPGQIYADSDYRKPGRTLRIDRLILDGEYAACIVLTNYDFVQESLDKGYLTYKDMRGSETCIKVRRFYAGARSYRLLYEPEELKAA